MEVAAEPPWTITQEQMNALLQEAAGATNIADSSHLWSWRSSGTVVELRADLQRATGPSYRAALLDGGAILLNLRLLIRGLGVHPAVRLFPDSGRRDLVATVWLEGPRPVTEQDRILVTAILSGGRPIRSAGESSTTPEALIHVLRQAAKTEQSWLAVQPMIDVLSITAQTPDPAPDGTALIIGTVLDGAGAQLHAGQAAQRSILSAAVRGVPTSPIRNLLHTDVNRKAVRELLGGGLWPQAILHMDVNLHPFVSPTTSQRTERAAAHPPEFDAGTASSVAGGSRHNRMELR